MRDKRIYVAGHTGLVGSALCRRLAREPCEVLTVPRAELDLRDQAAVRDWMRAKMPDIVVIAAAKVGGIAANMEAPADFITDNMMIETNLIHTSYEIGVEKLLFLGSSCIYPKDAPQPITEDALMSSALEPTNEYYAIAKIAGMKMVQAHHVQHDRGFVSAMPCNLYGPGDRFDAEASHVIPALMMRAHAAKVAGQNVLSIWGSGAPRREFLYVDDLADALVTVLRDYNGAQPVNIGAGQDITIADLARMICDVVGFEGELIFDTSRPDGVAAKLMDSSKVNALGWRPKIALQEGLARTYQWYLSSLRETQ